MPGSTTVTHNNVSMTFTENDHSYIDQFSKRYTSVTTLVSMGFEKFDSERIAKAKAAREGGDWRDLVNEWKENGQKAANAGTRLHENCERQILGHSELMHDPVDEFEAWNFKLASDAVERIKNEKDAIKFEPEKLVFSPKLGLAGSVDLLVTFKNNIYKIYDWKNIKDLSVTGFKGKKGIIDATSDLQDSNYWHYALQLQLYEIILKVEGYIPRDASVRRILNCFINRSFKTVELPDVMKNAKQLIKWYKNEI